MKKLLMLLALIIMPFGAASADDMMKDTMSKPSAYIVAYHADWCGSCKVLGPKVMEMKSGMSDELKMKVGFVKLDLTDDATKKASKMAAEKHGLGAHYADNAKTGQVKIIDAESGDVLAVMNKDFTVEEMKGAVMAVSKRS